MGICRIVPEILWGRKPGNFPFPVGNEIILGATNIGTALFSANSTPHPVISWEFTCLTILLQRDIPF